MRPVFIAELTCRAWLIAEANKRRTLQKSDVAAAIALSDMFDFLIDILPRDDDDAGADGGEEQLEEQEQEQDQEHDHDQEQEQEQGRQPSEGDAHERENANGDGAHEGVEGVEPLRAAGSGMAGADGVGIGRSNEEARRHNGHGSGQYNGQY